MNKTTCTECGGEGETWEDIWLGDVGGHSTKHYTCTECDGSGEVDAPEDEDDEPETAEFERASAEVAA